VHTHAADADRLRVRPGDGLTGGEGMQFGLRQVVKEGFASGGGEKDVALTPEDDGAGLLLTEEGLPLGIKSDVMAIVIEEIKLEAIAMWTLKGMEVVRVPVVGTDELRVR